VPSWHFNMLHDTARNEAFASAIAQLVKPEHQVLEIGSGSGLLALLAARGSDAAGGARRVVTCEANPLLARKATEIIARNGFSGRIHVIAKPSTEVELGADLTERADVLICEIFSVQVITEGVLPSLEDAKARLLKPGAIVIPSAATARAALVAGETLQDNVRVGTVCGFDLSLLNAFTPVVQYLQPGHRFTLLSDSVDLFGFDLANDAEFPSQKRTVEVAVRESGVCQGVLQWLRLDLATGVHFENSPIAATVGGPQHWTPIFYPFPEPVALESGQCVTLRVSHNRVGLRVELATINAHSAEC